MQHDSLAEFDHWAVYYDLIHDGLPGEAEYYVNEAIRSGGKVLELGCGTGRVCIPMACSGLRVTGLDISPNMLALCREKLAAAGPVSGLLELAHGDMRAFELNSVFCLVAMPYRTVMHLLTPEDQVHCFACVHRHLAEDGVFVFNTWAARPRDIARIAADSAAGEFRLVGRYSLPEDGLTLVHHHAVHYDEHQQLIIERHRIEERDSQGRVEHEAVLSLTRAWITPREMGHLACRCGFEVEALLGGFDGAPFTENSTEMIWRLRKQH